MRLRFVTPSRLILLLGIALGSWAGVMLCSRPGHAQTPPGTPAPQKAVTDQDQSDVLKVYTQLVQTDVMVFDKQGKFVSGLKPEDFELRIDGKPKPIEFFEKVTAGTVNEELQLAAARGASARPHAPETAAALPLDRGRPVFFYVDDLHMDLPAMQTARKLIERFIDNEMRQNDELAIASASGQIGFLQQLTDNKTVLRAALDRLKVRPYTVRDNERPPMTEYQALLIADSDRDVTSYFIEATIRDNPGISPDVAASMVASRAQSLIQQSTNVTRNTLIGLEGLVRSAEKLPGRKLVFFLSGGFFLENRMSDTKDRVQRITSAAARSGVVIYSMDVRGLVASLVDASTDAQFDPTGRLQRAAHGELSASMDGLNALARDTGGKPIFNTNSLDPGLAQTLKETANYYLLAWKPDNQVDRSSKFRRIEVKIIGHPELTVQVRRGFFDREPTNAESAKGEKRDKGKNEEPKTPQAQLKKVLVGTFPETQIPVALSLSYLKTPTKGPRLTAALQAPRDFFFRPA